jgi:hypothetical protein
MQEGERTKEAVAESVAAFALDSSAIGKNDLLYLAT